MNPNDQFHREWFRCWIKNSNLDIAKLLLESGATLSKENLQTCMGTNQLELIKIYLNKNGYEYLSSEHLGYFTKAACSGYFELANLLLDTPDLVRPKKDFDIVKNIRFLINSNPPIPIELMDRLLAKLQPHLNDYIWNYPPIGGYKPIYVAVMKGANELLSLFFKHGATIKTKLFYDNKMRSTGWDTSFELMYPHMNLSG